MDVLLALLTRNSCMWRQIWHAKDICLVLSEMKHATGHESRHCFSEPSQSAVRGEDNDWRQLCNISRREQHFCRNSISVGRFPAGWYSGLYWQYQLLCVREYSTVAVGCEDESILQCHIFLCSVSQSLAHINMSCGLIKLTRFFSGCLAEIVHNMQSNFARTYISYGSFSSHEDDSQWRRRKVRFISHAGLNLFPFARITTIQHFFMTGCRVATSVTFNMPGFDDQALVSHDLCDVQIDDVFNVVPRLKNIAIVLAARELAPR